MSEMSDIWRKAFATWPANFRRKGVVIPDGGEAIPFCDFVLNDSVVVLERPTPDNAGARRVAIPFHRIHNLKYTEPLKTDQFLKAGFVKEMSADEISAAAGDPSTVMVVPETECANTPPPVAPMPAPVQAAAVQPSPQPMASAEFAPPMEMEPNGYAQPAPIAQQPIAVAEPPQPASDPQEHYIEQMKAAILQQMAQNHQS